MAEDPRLHMLESQLKPSEAAFAAIGDHNRRLQALEKGGPSQARWSTASNTIVTISSVGVNLGLDVDILVPPSGLIAFVLVATMSVANSFEGAEAQLRIGSGGAWIDAITTYETTPTNLISMPNTAPGGVLNDGGGGSPTVTGRVAPGLQTISIVGKTQVGAYNATFGQRDLWVWTIA